MNRKTFISAAMATLLALGAGASLAQDYPAKPVRIMVGATAGGGTDILARMLADKFRVSMKQSFVVENRPGAANTLAADATAKAPADGYTLLVATNTGQAIAPHLLKLAYDPLKDLQPIGMVVVVPHLLLVGADEKARSAGELIAEIKANPSRYAYASSGIGSTQHIAGESLNLTAGTKAVHVPYKGSSAAHTDLIGGQVQFMLDTTSSAMGQVKAGALRALAVTTPKRLDELPNVPTVRELGMPSLEITTWYGLYTTAGTPRDVVDKLGAELQRTLKLPDVQERLRALGGQSEDLTLQQFTEFGRSEFERFGKLVKAANIKAQ
ncbi:tripartite tricarboxylate transporter substrate binding protein [Ramlibacter henchirensis]|uniref:Tripartite tricarboxylate transporter substrate binding protein n=1 Tax=Ramlibacter henchirensis TaxID=204072 RepID=A0A4Z0BWE4_9BURK|nr:tripartite tricarboxylate transporter substrate binding protein [Ramlibacter henchirensis]TFZ02670.1 tripartite tricarboxylate transporter substrate binding protein [Ramlibacter henchirensis]